MSGIGDLTTATVLGLGDNIPLQSAADNDARKASLTALVAFMQANLTFPTGALTPQYAAPSATAFNVAVNSGNVWLLLTPTAGFAAGTITLPANPVAGQQVRVSCTQAVTTLTVAGNGRTVTGAPTTIAANGFFLMWFDATLNAWFRAG